MGNGVPSSSRGSVATTLGLPHGQRCATAWIERGGRPSWADDGASCSAITGWGIGLITVGWVILVAGVGAFFGWSAASRLPRTLSHHGSGTWRATESGR